MTTVKKLENGAKYTVEERNTWKEKWEIINGIAYAMSPTPTIKHQLIQTNLLREISNYLDGKSCKVMGEIDVEFSQDEIVIPDIVVVCDEKKLADEINIKGAPELVIEILSPSTQKRDRIFKYHLYKKYGVAEYWIVDHVSFVITVHNFSNNTMQYYVYEEDNPDEKIPVGIFNGNLNIELKRIFNT